MLTRTLHQLPTRQLVGAGRTSSLVAANAVRIFSRCMSSSELARVGSPGVIMEPYIPPPSDGPPSFFVPAGWRYYLRRFTGFLRSGLAAAEIRKVFDDFQPNTAPDMAHAIIADVFGAYENSDTKKLRELVTEQIYPDVKRGIKMNWALTNTATTPLEFTRIIGPSDLGKESARPALRQMRVFRKSREGPDPAFAQLTFEVTMEMVSSVGEATEGSTSKKRKKRQRNKSAGRTLPPKGSGNMAGEWRQATDPDSGKPYWWHTSTRNVTWTQPAEFGRVRHSLGGGVSHTSVATSAGNSEDPDMDKDLVYQVTSFIVLERPLTKAYASQWRVCKLR